MTYRCRVGCVILYEKQKGDKLSWLNQDVDYYAVNVALEKQQGVKVVQIWINLFGLIVVLSNPVVKVNRKIIVENVMILFVLYFIPSLMTWNKVIMG